MSKENIISTFKAERSGSTQTTDIVDKMPSVCTDVTVSAATVNTDVMERGSVLVFLFTTKATTARTIIPPTTAMMIKIANMPPLQDWHTPSVSVKNLSGHLPHPTEEPSRPKAQLPGEPPGHQASSLHLKGIMGASTFVINPGAAAGKGGNTTVWSWPWPRNAGIADSLLLALRHSMPSGQAVHGTEEFPTLPPPAPKAL
mmetsp:Transcript_77137/g.249714  ORF Transcript_77137/g.249714 Transcript_77137/m.249714 type:complete len:200 (+) Transcript_77137:2191-2790(+)